jgi:5'-deoxynucleotidase YfbR-like HD superfamily hydrolase
MTSTSQNFNQIFQFLELLYRGNWQFRWGQVPFMDQSPADTKGESILAHEWSCITLWILLKPIMPALNKQIDSAKLYECLALHDIGEVVVGDTPIVEQLKVGSARKQEIEQREIATRIENLPLDVQKLVNNYFHEYTFAEKPDLTITLARYLNALQGNHFGLVYGNNLTEHRDLINEIVSKYFIPLSRDLMDQAIALDPAAGDEIRSLTDFHISAIRAKGI